MRESSQKARRLRHAIRNSVRRGGSMERRRRAATGRAIALQMRVRRGRIGAAARDRRSRTRQRVAAPAEQRRWAFQWLGTPPASSAARLMCSTRHMRCTMLSRTSSLSQCRRATCVRRHGWRRPRGADGRHAPSRSRGDHANATRPSDPHACPVRGNAGQQRRARFHSRPSMRQQSLGREPPRPEATSP